MPFPNFHSARVRQPGSFVEETIKEINQAKGGSIRFIGGRLKSDPDGSAVVQAVRFAKDTFTPAEAKAWLGEHEFKALEFEEATKEDSADDEVMRFDRTSAGKVERTDAGFLMADAVITRAGVFSYRMADGTTRRELRPPEEVFHPDSMKTAEMLPITNDHPGKAHGGRVTVDNAKTLAVGYTGQKVRQDGDNLRTPVKITTSDGVAAVEAGRRELSCGYRCRVEKRDGKWGEESYTHAQKRIRYNHIALVDEARAGHVATLRLDGADAVMVRPTTGKEPSGMGDMVKVKLGTGIGYDCAPEVAVELDKIRQDRVDLTSEKESASKAHEELQGKHDALAAKVAELEKRDGAAEIQTAVKARMVLVTAATPRVSKEVAEKFDGMTDLEIQKAVIIAAMPEAKLDEADAAYISGAFSVACQETTQKRNDGQGNVIVGSGEPPQPVNAEQARLDSQERSRLRSEGREPVEKSA